LHSVCSRLISLHDERIKGELRGDTHGSHWRRRAHSFREEISAAAHNTHCRGKQDAERIVRTHTPVDNPRVIDRIAHAAATGDSPAYNLSARTLRSCGRERAIRSRVTRIRTRQFASSSLANRGNAKTRRVSSRLDERTDSGPGDASRCSCGAHRAAP